MATRRKEITCPKCQNINLDSVPYVYQSLLSRGAGKDLFCDSPVINSPKLSEPQRIRLINRLTPPNPPKKSLPAGIIALMAFLISWLMTGSMLIGKIGHKTFFIVSLIIIAIIAYPFIHILSLVDKSFKRSVYKYNRVKAIWNRQYFCNDCHHVFLPKK